VEKFPETAEFIGTQGRITLHSPAHCPTSMTISGPAGETTVDYPLLTPAGPAKAPGQSWSSANGVVQYKGQGWNFGNQHGFTHQAEAVHRCVAAGLKECPQFTKEESLHAMAILDSIHAQTGMR
jgi:dihydrodiol dehydrogenase / D-xylose 1-dehydrogenase (NADP)